MISESFGKLSLSGCKELRPEASAVAETRVKEKYKTSPPQTCGEKGM